jgi:hypothetical protein
MTEGVLSIVNYPLSIQKNTMSDEKKPKKVIKKKKPIDKLSMGINEFGELKSNINLDDVNRFLNENVDDKKLNEKKT